MFFDVKFVPAFKNNKSRINDDVIVMGVVESSKLWHESALSTCCLTDTTEALMGATEH